MRFCDTNQPKRFSKSQSNDPTSQIHKKPNLGYICTLKNTPNRENEQFGIHFPLQKHPKSRKRAIWDTFSPSKPPQIEKTSNLGYICPFKTTPNQENEQFGIHLPLQNHPKPRKRAIWDTFAPKNTEDVVYKSFRKILSQIAFSICYIGCKA